MYLGSGVADEKPGGTDHEAAPAAAGRDAAPAAAGRDGSDAVALALSSSETTTQGFP